MARLLIVTPTHSPHGGVERIIESLAAGLPDHGFDVTVGLATGVTWHRPERFRAEYPAVRTIDIDGTSGVRAGRLRGLRRALTRVRPDIVLNARLFDAYEAVRQHRAQGELARLAVTIQAYEPEYISDLAAYGSLVDCCITSGRLIAAAVKRFAVSQADHVVSIPGGVRPATRFADRQPATPIRLGYVGRLQQEQKRVLDLVDTLVVLRTWDVPFVCHVAGTGPAEAQLRRAIAERDLDRFVTLDGWKGLEALYQEVYPNLDVLLHFAEWEGITIAPREAMAHGVVPVISRFLGLRYEGHFRHRENCMTFDVGDSLAAAQHIRQLAEDTELWRRLSLSARRSEEGEWSDKGALGSWAQALRECLERPPARVTAVSPLRFPPSGRLARVLGEDRAYGLRSLVGRRVVHAGPGGEWPHCSGVAVPAALLSEIVEFGRTTDREDGKPNRTVAG